MKHMQPDTEKTPRLDRRKKVILNTLLVVSVVWYPLTFFLNPGWYTLGLMVHPEMLLTALMPLVAVEFANAIRPRGEKLPRTLFWMEVAFCLLWILLWCFVVNGSDTEESMHSIFSRVFSGIFGEKILVGISSSLFGCTAIVLTLLAFLMAIYKQYPLKSIKHAVWGRRLLIANFTYFLVSFSAEPIFSSFNIFINPYWTWWYLVLAIVVALLGVLNIVYLVRYFATTEKASRKVWAFGVLVILVSLYFIWSSSGLILFFLGVGRPY